MLSNIWGAGEGWRFNWPNGLAAAVLLSLLIFLTVWAIWREGGPLRLRSMNRSQWALFVGLCAASFLLSQLFPLAFPWADPVLSDHPATATMTLFSAAPYLLAGIVLNTPASIIVGLFAGAGRTLAQTGEPADIFIIALAAGTSASLLRQNYAGFIFKALRQPVVAGSLGRLLVVVGIGVAVMVRALPQAGVFGALDLALFVGSWSTLPLLIEGLVGGAIATAALWTVPQWRPNRGVVPSPLARSLQRQIVTAFLSFAIAVVLLSALTAFFFSARSTERAVTQQMVDSVDATAQQLNALQGGLTTTLAQFGREPQLATGDPVAKSAILGRMQATPQFDAVRLIDSTGTMVSAQTSSGQQETQATLSAAEMMAVNDAQRRAAPRWLVEEGADGPIVSLAIPYEDKSGERSILLASIAPEGLEEAIAGLSVIDEFSQGLIVDEYSQVVMATREMRSDSWVSPTTFQLDRSLSAVTGQNVYKRIDPATGARQLVYQALAPESGWKVVAVTPKATILRRTLSIIGPLAGLLLAISALFYALVATLGQNITRPIAEMSRASRAIADGGGLERSVRSDREDEIGQLSLAFSQMQRALRQRLDELSLLLSVSNDVAGTIHIEEGMAAVLQGVLRGTGAAGARAIVRNPNAPAPLSFAEGPAADSMAVLDRAILLALRSADELAYGSAAEIESGLGIDNPPGAALFALPLKPAGEFQGVLYLVYRQSHYFDRDERNLLRTLAGQATVLVQNAHLFVAAEGGRRRLAAILASTTNGVIVTDQTDRVLLFNPAMERAFGLRSKDITGRPVVDVLAGLDIGGALARRMSLGMSSATGEPADGKLEVEVNGRSYLAGISTVFNSDGQMIGRVAVLQDVTDLKNLDRLKSDFVAGISHDLLSPLTIMHNYASLLPMIDDPETEREYTEKILGGIERMKRLVNDLLDLARIEAGLNLQFDRIRIDELLTEVAQEYAMPARERGLHLVVEADEMPLTLADPNLLRRAIINLVTNAMKYAPDSGPLTLRAEAKGMEIVISVHDRGPGISVADQSHLFEKFYRGQISTTDKTKGSGLGLAIVKSVADLHGGRVWFESSPGEGSTFNLAIPRKVYSA
ncbi:MAG: HAMP domain-containing protein [Anaerolineae bacterium]|nr:HAMP domain-containing protein [Anaerolineae bacterium]